MKNNYFVNRISKIIKNNNYKLNSKISLTLVLILGITFLSYSQKNGGGKRTKDIIPVVYCVKVLGNGLLQANFGYENPNKKEVTVNDDGSIIKSNNGKRVAKGLTKFKKGSNDKVFTKEFGPHDYVEWTIISNGNTHTVIANANSAKCDPDDGFIEPVIGNGKSLDIIGQELTSLCEDIAGNTPSDLIFQVNNGKILVEIVPVNGQMQNVITLLQTQFNIPASDFLLDLNSYNSLSAIDVYMEKTSICPLNDHSDIINFARPVYPANTNSGGVLTQGDAAQTSDMVRESFRVKNSSGDIVKVEGNDITIGVLSDSYDMAIPGVSLAAIDVANGELPEGVVVLKDNEFKATDEGRAMMQIMHDVAPRAALQFHTATASPRQFEVGFNALALESDIIVDDITFITEPFFGTGRISQAIQSFLSSPGKMHFTSAGNIANKAYNGVFNSSANVPATNFIDATSPAKAHVFGNNTDGSEDFLQKISVVPGTYLIALQWKENAASQQNQLGALDDLDIYIVDDLGRLLVGSNRINIAGDPTEIIVFRATGTGEANILITSANGSTNVPLRYIAFRTNADDGTPDGLKIEEYFGNGAPTVSGHAMTPESITVGAVDYRNADNPVAESFSSYGGLLPDGTYLNIDLYAPDGGNTASTTIGQDANCSTCDNDGILNFYGTSASAPHAAGAVALLMSAAPSWYPDGSFSANSALQTFQNTATNFSAADGSNGRFINTLAAFKSIAAQTARITELIVEDGKTPSTEPFTVTIIGEFFPENQEDVSVLFDGQPLEDVTYTIADDGTTIITATVPMFSGNPELVVVAKSTTPGDTDGGASDPAFFFDEGKIALSIIANNAQFEYGQDINPSYYRPDSSQPDYTSPYTVQGLLEGVTFESLDLPPVQLNNSALNESLAGDGYPIVFDYVITPSFGEADYDHDLFQINFISGFIDPELGKTGYLTVTKKDLTITTEDVTYTYGEAINLPLLYTYDGIGIPNNSPETGFYSLIKTSHASDFKDGLPNKFRAVVSKFRAVVSDYNLLDLLNGSSWSASERTIENKFRAVVSGMSIIELDNEHFTNFIDAQSDFETDPTINKFRAVVSKFRAVVSAEELFSGEVDLSIDNKFRAVVSKFKAVVSTDDPSNPYSAYSSAFAIIDAEDAPPEDGSDSERAISNMFSLNMITGLEVTSDPQGHYVYPGAFLNATSANFNITYESGSLIILPKDLNVSLSNLTIPYGEILTTEKLNLITDFEGWAFEGEFQESVETVFPDGVPYYFIKVGGDGTALELIELKEIGDYVIGVKNSQNYIMNLTNDETNGIVTISPTNLTAETASFEASYGESFEASDLATVFGDFAYTDESEETVFPDGVPYYFVDADLNEYELGDKMIASTYQIKIRGTEKYLMEYGLNHGSLTITPTPLTVKTMELEIEYGDDLKAAISTVISGFAFGETRETVFPDGISYLFIDGLDAEFDIEAVKELGIYTVNVLAPTASANYEILYAVDHGILMVSPRHVVVKTDNLTKDYGYNTNSVDLTTEFVEFAPNETSADVFGSIGIPYYFENDSGQVYNLGDALEVGDYDIKIEETNNHYIFEYDNSANVLSITQNTLVVTIDDLIINQGDTPLFTSNFEGFVFGESVASVFPDGIPYYIVDEAGNERGYNEVGVFTIKIRATKNNLIDSNDAKLYINPSNAQKIRTYADCVAYDPSATDGLFYTVNYSYENNNDVSVFVLEGIDNNLSGPANYEGQLPTVFLPGSGTFEIRFDGKRLVWNLTTFGSRHKSSVSSSSTSESGKCDAKLDGTYTIYPNPVSVDLNILQNVPEVSDVTILNMYGSIVYSGNSFDGIKEIITVNMSEFSSGLYIVRIVSASKVRTFNIIKE